MKCCWCGEELKYVKGRGWLHAAGGLYMVRCKSCGWKAAPPNTPKFCPECGGDVVDDHYALPVAGR